MERLVKPVGYLAALLLVAGGIAVARPSDEDKTYTVTAYFTKAIGLFKNSDVDVLGVAVGKVTDVEPVGTKVKVVMEIDSEVKIPADAFAQIVPISIISDRYVQLEPPYESGPALKDGDVIDVDRTQIPAELDDVFRQLKKLLEAIEPGSETEPGALGQLIVQLDRTLRGRESDLRKTLLTGSDLSATLAGASEHVSGILVNLDELFATLETRASSIGSLNRNFASVMATLLESRADLEGTLRNLAKSTEQVGDLFRDHRKQLGTDLEIAGRITSTILENRESVEQSLEWLPVVAIGFTQANHPEPVDATDVRDNLFAKIECSAFDPLPSPIREFLQERCRSETGEPPPAPEQDRELDCDKGVKRVQRQLRRLEEIGLPGEVHDEITRPLKRKLRRLAKQCRELGHIVSDPDELIERILKDIGAPPAFPPSEPEDDDEGGVASGAGGGFAGASASGDAWAGVARWFDGLLDFVGWRR